MKISIFWTGYVGLVTWACLADIGHEVLCIDIDEKKIENLKKGIIPIYELGLEEIVKKNYKNKRVLFSTDAKKWVEFGEVVFNAVGTPPDKQNQDKADLQYVFEVAKTFGKYISEYKILINKSTVPVGTGEKVKELISKELKKRKKKIEFDIVSNPEFLREGTAVKDFMLPDRVVCGIENKKSKHLMEEVYKPILRNYSTIVFTDIPSAELAKYAANTFLATKISFINQIANFAELVGANIKDVSKAIGLDKRIGNRFLHAGIGYGGSCFPKDVKALIESGKEFNFDFSLPQIVEEINEQQKIQIIEKISQKISLKWKNIALWWLAFKPKTDDLREAPSLQIIDELIKKWVKKISAYDPVASENYKKYYSKKEVAIIDDMYESLKKADVLIVCTEWDEFRIADLKKMKKLMNGKIIADGRNIFERDEVEKIWLIYIWVWV